MAFKAFITAGGLISGDFAEEAGTTIKALIRIGGRSILRRTIDALKGCSSVGEIALIAPGEVKHTPDAEDIDEFIEAHASGVENIVRGLMHFRDEKKVILCTSDLPFISSPAVSDFLDRCPDQAQFCYPIFEHDEIDPAMRPGVPSYIPLKDGRFTGGSLFLLDVAASLAGMKTIGYSFRARKSALGMALLLGPSVVIRMLFRQCTSADLVKRVETIMGGRCAALRNCDPAITIDIDDERSYRFACGYAAAAEGR